MYFITRKVRRGEKAKKGFTAEKENRNKEIHVVQFINDLVGRDNGEKDSTPHAKKT